MWLIIEMIVGKTVELTVKLHRGCPRSRSLSTIYISFGKIYVRVVGIARAVLARDLLFVSGKDDSWKKTLLLQYSLLFYYY